LRTLLAATTIVAGLCGLVAYERTKSARQKAAVKALESREGIISYGVDLSPRPYALKLLLGDDIYGKMTEALLNDPSISDSDLAHLESLPGITYLSLGSSVTDGGLIHLKQLKYLSVLYLGDTRITNDGLKTVGMLRQLDELYLDHTSISDHGLAHISGMRLRHLSLAGTSITDAGLENLEGMTQLEVLNLGGTSITDAGLIRVGKIKSLKEVYVTLTPVTDTGKDTLLNALPNVILLDRFRPRGDRIRSY